MASEVFLLWHELDCYVWQQWMVSPSRLSFLPTLQWCQTQSSIPCFCVIPFRKICGFVLLKLIMGTPENIKQSCMQIPTAINGDVWRILQHHGSEFLEIPACQGTERLSSGLEIWSLSYLQDELCTPHPGNQESLAKPQHSFCNSDCSLLILICGSLQSQWFLISSCEMLDVNNLDGMDRVH